MKIAARALLALAAVALLLVWVLARRSPPHESRAPAAAAEPGANAPPAESSRPDDRTPAAGHKLDRRQAFELGKRVFVPRPSTEVEVVAATPPPHHPRALRPGGGDLVDRRPDGGADWPSLKTELEKRMTEVRESASRCLDGWAQEDPSLDEGIVLAISVDEQGLRDVWINDRAEAPRGALACLSNAVYPIDWSGLTKQPMRLTVRVGYAPRDAGDPPARD
jgi:hypothetical protein